MTQLGLPAHCISISTNAKSIEADARKIRDLSKFEVLRVSGIAATPDWNLDCDFSDGFAEGMNLSKFAPAIGEWTAVARGPGRVGAGAKRFILLNDEYGYSPIFYCLLPGKKIIASDSFNGVVHELQRHGIAPSLDISTYLASIATKDSRFSNPFVSTTFSDSIRVLPPHKFLHVANEAISIHDRQELLEVAPESSDNLVKQGVDFVAGTLSRLAGLSDFKHSLLLSGGVDSRTVLALIVHAGVQNAFSLRVNDPRLYKNKYTNKVFEEDFYISYQLGNDLDMDWQGVRESFRVDTSLEETMMLSQSYSSNFSHALTPASHHPIYKYPEVSLRGGGGEPIKGAGFLSLKRQVESHESLQQSPGSSAFEKFKIWYLGNALIKTQLQGEIGEALDELAVHFDSESFDSAMPHLYQQTRNRTHFGHAKYSSSSNLFPFQPLSNSYFYAATKSMEQSALRDFSLTQQIFQAAAPELLHYPFESSDATQKLALSQQREIRRDTKALETHFAHIASTRLPSTVLSQPGTPNDRFLQDKNSALLSLCRTLAHDVEEAFPEHRNVLRSGHREAIAAIELGVLSATTTAARLRSARDVFSPTAYSGVSIEFRTAEPSNDPISLVGIKHPAFAAPPKLQNPGVLPQVVLKPNASNFEGQILVSANAECSRRSELEFAFYLLENGRAVHKIQYQSLSQMELSLPKDSLDSALSVKVFARHYGQSYPCAIETVVVTP